ncbi:MAG: hypothetical protein MEEGG_02951 [Eggerthella lenta]
MRFWVSVPVLSVQMTVTAPIVSQACILRTRLLVLSIRRMDIASDSVIDIGSPSGTAMTMMATETMKICRTCWEIVSQSPSSSPPTKTALPSITQKISTDRRMPRRPIRRERRVNWRSSGVCSSFCTVACSVTRPASVASPTAVTTITP